MACLKRLGGMQKSGRKGKASAPANIHKKKNDRGDENIKDYTFTLLLCFCNKRSATSHLQQRRRQNKKRARAHVSFSEFTVEQKRKIDSHHSIDGSPWTFPFISIPRRAASSQLFLVHLERWVDVVGHPVRRLHTPRIRPPLTQQHAPLCNAVG